MLSMYSVCMVREVQRGLILLLPSTPARGLAQNQPLAHRRQFISSVGTVSDSAAGWGHQIARASTLYISLCTYQSTIYASPDTIQTSPLDILHYSKLQPWIQAHNLEIIKPRNMYISVCIHFLQTRNRPGPAPIA